MTTQVKLPQMGESVDSGTVLSILVSRGDRVQEGDGLIEVETDKATVEIPSPQAGTVDQIHVDEGDGIETGQPIVTLSAGNGDAAEDAGDRSDGEERGGDDHPHKAAGTKRKPEAEPRKEADEEERRPEPAKREEDEERSGDGDRQAAADTTGADEAATETHQSGGDAGRDAEHGEGRRGSGKPVTRGPASAAPSVRRFARELGVDVADVAGAGLGGQITLEDVKAFVRGRMRGETSAAGTRSSSGERLELPDFARWGEVERQPMSTVRRATADVVHESWWRIPHVTQFDRADITDLVSFRERFRGAVEAAGGRLTLTAILIKIAGEALGHFPRFNASVDENAAELVLKRFVNIGVAVDTDRGLLTPVVRDAGVKDLTRIAVELYELAGKAREGAIAPDDLQGASFTVTNLGVLGTTVFTPIVPWPQVATLAVGRAEPAVVLRDGDAIERTILPIGLSYDHRCVDGADAARFLRFVAEVLEEPLRLAMEPDTGERS